MHLDWTAFVRNVKPDATPAELKNIVEASQAKLPVQNPSFICDGLSNYPHMSAIQKLSLISRDERGKATIGALDQEGVISVWSVLELFGENLESEADINFNMGIGSKVKLQMNYNEYLA